MRACWYASAAISDTNFCAASASSRFLQHIKMHHVARRTSQGECLIDQHCIRIGEQVRERTDGGLDNQSQPVGGSSLLPHPVSDTMS